jgi:prevent-host-death family protein
MSNAVWQVQEAKNRFSELIACALTQGPQVVTRHGRAVIRVVAVDASGDLLPAGAPRPEPWPMADDGFAQYLLSAPQVEELQTPVRRSRAQPVVLGG